MMTSKDFLKSIKVKSIMEVDRMIENAKKQNTEGFYLPASTIELLYIVYETGYMAAVHQGQRAALDDLQKITND